ncbi:MAG: YgiQ family radical SAM protein [archaeon]
MEYDIIFVTGEIYFDHPLCGVAILRRLLEKKGYKVGVIEKPIKEEEITKLGKPKLFFGVTSGSIDSMVRNYTPLKRLREEDDYLDYDEKVPDRAVSVYSNWIKHKFKGSIIVLGGTEASLRRFVHYDYWQNRLRKPILFDTRADIMAYGSAEKQILEIANRVKAKKDLIGIEGTCVISKESKGLELPSYEEVVDLKERFCDMQNRLSNETISQKIDNRYVVQFKSPEYTSKDLDEYYEMDFSRESPKRLSGFEFSVVTHRGCIGQCSFCSVGLLQGDRIISRSEESILREVKKITKMKHFKGNIDDLSGPSSNMYGMDCNKCKRDCIDCDRLDVSGKRYLGLLRKIRKVEGVKKLNLRSGIRFDLASPELVDEIAKYHVFNSLRIAPEHVNENVLKLMNKNRGDFKEFVKYFAKTGREVSFYFMTAHPGSSMKEAKELADVIKKLKNAEKVQIFTPTPMTVSTCMYYTGMDPKTKKKVYVPYTYSEKKEQKRIIFEK